MMMPTTTRQATTLADVRLAAAKERRRRQKETAVQYTYPTLAGYKFDPYTYIVERLGWTPWSGTDEHPGQVQVIEAYRLALLQLHEKDKWEKGELTTADLQHWKPGEVIKNRLHIEAGHTVGKTKLLSGLFSHFFDCIAEEETDGCIEYTFAPTYEQINDLLWKEIRTDRRRNPDLPGTVLEKPELKYKPNHFAKGKATSNANNAGTERAQGQHEKYLMFTLDEAEGIADFVWGAVDSMASGGIAIVIMTANPRTRTSKFFRQRGLATVAKFRISCHHHPNVIHGREIVPGAVRRDYVVTMVEKHCRVVPQHNPDWFTFELPWEPGVIYRPHNEYLFRVMGIPPKETSDDTFIPSGRYESAVARKVNPVEHDLTTAYIGIDAARRGSDFGTLYIRHAGRIWRQVQFFQLDSNIYYQETRKAALRLAKLGVTKLHIRVDGTGGFGGGVIDLLKMDIELEEAFDEFKVIEVHFGSAAHDPNAYDLIVTEMYAEAGETIKGIQIVDPPNELEIDLTARKWKWVNRAGKTIKRLVEKDEFKVEHGRSPDDGDGFVLCAAPPHIFTEIEKKLEVGTGRVVTTDQLGLT